MIIASLVLVLIPCLLYRHFGNSSINTILAIISLLWQIQSIKYINESKPILMTQITKFLPYSLFHMVFEQSVFQCPFVFILGEECVAVKHFVKNLFSVTSYWSWFFVVYPTSFQDLNYLGIVSHKFVRSLMGHQVCLLFLHLDICGKNVLS